MLLNQLAFHATYTVRDEAKCHLLEAKSSKIHNLRGIMIKGLLLLVFVPIAFCAVGGLVGRTQSSGARGVLHCNGKPARNVLVKLYDDDRGVVF